MQWDDLDYWQSAEWREIQENIDGLERLGSLLCPERSNLFNALDAVEFDNVRACVVGQDPYPSRLHATGIAFSIPSVVQPYPPTLSSILTEYSTDLRLPKPTSGDLTPWCKQGVLLWNAIPSTLVHQSLAHKNWFGWHQLTEELVEKLGKKGVVIAFLGSVARNYTTYVDETKSKVLEFSHPSPRGSLNSRNPFRGSRLFSTINAKLIELGKEPVNWRLS